jgi:hypothetical protein
LTASLSSIGEVPPLVFVKDIGSIHLLCVVRLAQLYSNKNAGWGLTRYIDGALILYSFLSWVPDVGGLGGGPDTGLVWSFLSASSFHEICGSTGLLGILACWRTVC